MQIKVLKLQNIRSYVDETIEFPSGSILLTGDIGAGKSTILLAIEYALFGTKRGELESTSLLRNGAHAGRIELVLDINKQEVKIIRTLRRTAQSVKQEAGSLVIDTKRLDLTPMELRARIISLLGYPQENSTTTKDLIYRYTVFTPQEQMRQIVYEDKETRLNTLRKVFHIDKYKRIRENAATIAKELRVKKAGLQETIETLPKYETIIAEIEKNVEEKKVNKTATQEELNQHKETKSQSEKKLSVLQEKEKKFYALQTEAAVIQANTEKLEQDQKTIQIKILLLETQVKEFEEIVPPQKPSMEKSMEQLMQKKQELENHVAIVHQEKVTLLQSQKYLIEQQQQLKKDIEIIEKCNEEIKNKKKELENLEKEISNKSELENGIQELQNEKVTNQGERTRAMLEQEHALHTKQQIGSVEVCTLCYQKINETHRNTIIEKEENVQKNAEEQIKKKELEIKQIDEKLKEFDLQLQNILTTEKNKAILISQIQLLEEKNKGAQEKELQLRNTDKNLLETHEKRTALEKEDVSKKQEEIILLNKTIEQYISWEKEYALYTQKEHQQKEKKKEKEEAVQTEEKVRKEIDEALQRKTFLARELLLYEHIQKEIIEEKRIAEQIQKLLQEKEVQFLLLEKEISLLLQEQEKQKQAMEYKTQLILRLDKIRDKEHWLEEFFIPLSGTIEKHVFFQLHGSFSEFFSKWFLMIMDENGMNARLDDSFTPVVEQDGYEIDLLDLSGGEKTAVALAYRLALNKVINEFISTIQTKNIIILDEPTDGFSAEQLDKIREVLDELQLGQMILVSHEQKIESFVDHTLRIEKIGYVSRVV